MANYANVLSILKKSSIIIMLLYAAALLSIPQPAYAQISEFKITASDEGLMIVPESQFPESKYNAYGSIIFNLSMKALRFDMGNIGLTLIAETYTHKTGG